MKSKIKNISEIEELSKKLKEKGYKIVTTNGTFDIVHYAHVHLLEKAKAEGNILIVLLNSDNSVRRNKGPTRPIIPQQERAEMIAAIGCVDYVVLFDEDTPLEALKKIKPSEHIKGGSFDPERMKTEKEIIESMGGQYRCFELEEGFSTTNIIEKILKNHNSN